MRNPWWVFGLVWVLGAALAQAQGQGNLDPSVLERFRAYQPVFELSSSVHLLLEMDGQKGLALSRGQAQRLLPILKRLQGLPDLKPTEAEQILAEIEDKILTPAQLKWMDTRRLEMARERRNRQGPPPGQRQAPRPQGGGAFRALAQGQPFNPFREGRAAEDLKVLIARLEKR